MCDPKYLTDLAVDSGRGPERASRGTEGDLVQRPY